MIQTVISIGSEFGIRSSGIGSLLRIVFMSDKFYKRHIFLEDAFPSDPSPMRFLSLLYSAIRQYFWPNPRCGATIPAHLSRRTLLSAVTCSGICVAVSLAAILTLQIAFSRVYRSNQLGLSQDGFYAMSGWTFLLYDLIHIYVIGVFAFWLVRSLCWEAWIGGSALIIASLADFGSLSVSMFLRTPALSALANGEPVIVPNPEAGYDVICSTLDFAQASFALVGSFFLAGAAMKAQGTARLAGWFILAGFPLSIFQIAEVGLHTPWTAVVDDWVTPISEIMEHLIMAICLWYLFCQKSLSPESQATAKTPKKTALA
jgi:hypothetical protein